METHKIRDRTSLLNNHVASKSYLNSPNPKKPSIITPRILQKGIRINRSCEIQVIFEKHEDKQAYTVKGTRVTRKY